MIIHQAPCGNSKQSVNDFDRALKETDKELERAIEQSCKCASEEIQRQRERSIQRTQRVERQLRHINEESRSIERYCENSRKRSKYVAEAFERTEMLFVSNQV